MADRTHTKILNVSYYVRDCKIDSVSCYLRIFLKKLLTISMNVFMIIPFILRESLGWSFTYLSKKQTKVPSKLKNMYVMVLKMRKYPTKYYSSLIHDIKTSQIHFSSQVYLVFTWYLTEIF